MPELQKCSCCDRKQNEVKFLVPSKNGKLFICDRCVGDSHSAIQEALATSMQVDRKEEPLRKPKEIKAFLDEHVIGQERAKRSVAIAVYNHYKRRSVKPGALPVKIKKANIILTGPSGTGKTEIFRAISEMLRVPFFVSDATRLTSAGYVGDDVESCLQGLMQDAGGDVTRAEWGIVLIDEFDKLARKSGRNATGYRDVSGEGVQQALLKIVEGSKVPVPRGMGKNATITQVGADGSVRSNVDIVDTSNILFVCAGSFAGIEEIVEQRMNKKARLGFGIQNEKKKLSPSDIYEAITEEDILEFGIIPELKGRLPILTTTLQLTEEQMVQILTEPKHAILKQYKALFAMDGVDLQFDQEALLAIGREAKTRPTGARSLQGILEDLLQEYCFTTPSDPDVVAVRIHEETVTKKAPATLVRLGGLEKQA